MDYLLLGGSSNVGKSESIYRLANALAFGGFTIVEGAIPATFSDFKVILSGLNRAGNLVYVLLNSPTDDVARIGELKKFYDESKFTINMIISSVRSEGEWQRKYFYSHMKINLSFDFILEIPLAKITRRGLNFRIALTWYQQSVDTLLNRNLAGLPFNI